MHMFVTVLPYVLSLFDNMMVFVLNFILLDINNATLTFFSLHLPDISFFFCFFSIFIILF